MRVQRNDSGIGPRIQERETVMETDVQAWRQTERETTDLMGIGWLLIGWLVEMGLTGTPQLVQITERAQSVV